MNNQQVVARGECAAAAISSTTSVCVYIYIRIYSI
jgi:hypothetical protein